MRVACLYDTNNCCRNVRLESEHRVGPASRYQSNLLGNYTATELRNGRFFYTKDEGNHILKSPTYFTNNTSLISGR